MFTRIKKLFGGKDEIKILSPIEGEAVSIKEVSDPTFSEELLGKGIAIKPKKGRVVAPVNGTLTVLFDTKHAITITSDEGVEILIHVGLDTVTLKGEHYKAYKTQGDKVKAGELILEFDVDAIKGKGFDVITPVIICNSSEYPNMNVHTGDVKELDTIIEL